MFGITECILQTVKMMISSIFIKISDKNKLQNVHTHSLHIEHTGDI